MKKFRTVASVIIMVIAGIVGFFIGAFLNEPMAGTILFSMIAGIACIVYAIDNHEEQGKFQFVEQLQQNIIEHSQAKAWLFFCEEMECEKIENLHLPRKLKSQCKAVVLECP